MARFVVVQRRELLHASLADLVHDPLAETPVEVADQGGVRLGELSKWAVEEVDAHIAFGGAVPGRYRRLESEPFELTGEGPHAGPGPGPFSGLDAPRVAGVRGVADVGADLFGQRGEEPGEQRVGGRIEAQAGRARGEEVEVLGASDGAAMDRFGVHEVSIPEAFKVEAHGVGVDSKSVRQLRR